MTAPLPGQSAIKIKTTQINKRLGNIAALLPFSYPLFQMKRGTWRIPHHPYLLKLRIFDGERTSA